jgi:hypothetical protein
VDKQAVRAILHILWSFANSALDMVVSYPFWPHVQTMIICFLVKSLAVDAACVVFDLGVSDEKGRSKDRPRVCMKY